MSAIVENGGSEDGILEHIENRISVFLANKIHPKILEAGCGSLSNFDIPETAHIVGIDISQAQLDKNSVVHEKILGDIQEYELPEKYYDLIVCWNVLEHLKYPRKALGILFKSVRDDGLLIIAFPNFFSVKGLLTKVTPFGFHRLIYKTAYGSQRFGSPGYDPFPTFLKYEISPTSLKKFASENMFSVEYYRTFESGVQKKLRKKCLFEGTRWSSVKTLVKSISLGIVDAEGTDCVMILCKK